VHRHDRNFSNPGCRFRAKRTTGKEHAECVNCPGRASRSDGKQGDVPCGVIRVGLPLQFKKFAGADCERA
jgi:hypothetical protein